MNIFGTSIGSFLETVRKQFTESVSRFPLAVVASVGLTITALALINEWVSLGDSLALKLILGLVFAYLLSISVSLFSASSGWKPLHHNAGQIAAALLVFLYALIVPATGQEPTFDFIASHLLIFAALGGLIFVAPYIRNFFQADDYSHNFYRFAFRTVQSVIAAAVLGFSTFFLGAFVLFSLDELFNLSIGGDVYGSWFVLSMIGFASLYGLAQLPQRFDQAAVDVKDGVNTVVRFACLYIVLPFLAIFTVIVYAYSVMAVVQGGWPQQSVSWMIMWYGAIGYLLYLVSYPYDSAAFRVFKKYWPLVLVLPLVMLFYSIGLRIEAYGVTINRYLVVLFGLWLALLSVYFVFSARKRIVVIPALVSVMSLLVLLSPFNLYSLPQYSQLKQLENNLEQLGLYQDGTAVPAIEEAEYDSNTVESVRSGIRYLCENHGCQSMRDLLSGVYNPQQIDDSSSYYGAQVLIESLKLDTIALDVGQEGYVYFNQDMRADPVPVGGFSQAIWVQNYDQYYDQQIYVRDGEIVGLYESPTSIQSELQAFIDQYASMQPGPRGMGTTGEDASLVSFDASTDRGTIRVYPESINAEQIDEQFEITYLSLFILLP